MDNNSNTFIKALIYLVSAFCGSILIGFILFQNHIFDPHNFTYQFIINGALGAIFFSLLKMVKLSLAVLIFVVFCIFDAIIMPGAFKGTVLFVGILTLIALGCAIYVYWRYGFTLVKTIWARSLFLAGTLAVLNIFNAIILIFIYKDPGKFGQAVFTNLSIGFLIGLGLGLGTEVGTCVINSMIDRKKGDKFSEEI